MASFSRPIRALKNKLGWDRWNDWHPISQTLVKIFPLILILLAIPLTVGVLQKQQIFQQFAGSSNPCTISGSGFTPSSSTFSIVSGPDASIKPTEATITWNLCDYGTGIVDYGTTTNYGSTSRFENTFNYKFHLQTLSNLKPGTTYHFRVTSKNKAGATVISADNVFTTPASSLTSTTTPATVPTTPTPTIAATIMPTVSAGNIPSIPVGYGQVFKKNFSDGLLSPFRIITYPNSHPGDLMIAYGKFVSDSSHISIHNGYLDLKATRNADGTWSQAFVGTGLNGDGSPATFKFQYGKARVMARMNSGKGAWQSLWYLVADSWSSPEIDWAELISGKLTANLHGSSADGQKTSRTPFSENEWHEYGIVKTPSYIAFTLDGTEIARANVAITANMGLLADAKVGLTAPDSTTPSPLFLQVAWWTVDPL